MNTSQEILERITAEAKRASHEVRCLRACLAGEAIRQGDVYLLALPSIPQRFDVATPPAAPSRQLVNGDSPGSRHVLEGDGDVYPHAGAGPYQGPYVHVRSRATLTHPEHAHISLPAGWYEVRYQIDYEHVDDTPPAGSAPLIWKELTRRAHRVID